MDEALADSGLVDVAVTYRLLTTSDEAAAVPFAGSPTILIDGVDALPDADRVTELARGHRRTHISRSEDHRQ
ncbi:UNVERIFIED_ORG: hypothetical protein FNL38_102296 [Nocardia globerula]|uniref:Thioredoxin-like protein n=1 Tax=Nocardia globerula TaxID=1818 RepID=A0A652YTC7_NOCGL